jgi:flagellar hook assembly protein FlgD
MNQAAGYKLEQWDATNDAGESVSAGLYFYTFQAGEFNKTNKMLLVK